MLRFLCISLLMDMSVMHVIAVYKYLTTGKLDGRQLSWPHHGFIKIIIIIIIYKVYIAPYIICKEIALRRFTTL